MDALADRQFIFKIEPSSSIEKVLITHLRLSLLTGKNRKVTLEVNPDSNPEAIYELLESLKFPRFNVTQVGIKVLFKAQPGRKATTRKFKISYPNWCGLKHEGDDKIIHAMLAESGIEPTKINTE